MLTLLTLLSGEATGRTNAKMHWSPDGYADKIVKGERKKIAGVWPAGVPFGDPSHIQGGCAPLQKLLDAWERGEVWFADATAEDVRRAAMDPRSVLPGEPLRPRLRKSPYECPGSSRRRLPGLGPVLHSSHMGVVARPCPPEHVLAGRLESGRHTGRTGYREDNSATRARPVSNPENVPLQHARTGVKTGRWVMDYDGVEDGVIEVDDDLMRLLEEGVYEAVEGGEGCGESWV